MVRGLLIVLLNIYAPAVGGVVGSILIYSIDEQFLNAYAPIFVTVAGIVIFSKAEHSSKALAPIDVIDGAAELLSPWNVTLLNDVHPANASLPIEVTVRGMVMLSRLVQP